MPQGPHDPARRHQRAGKQMFAHALMCRSNACPLAHCNPTKRLLHHLAACTVGSPNDAKHEWRASMRVCGMRVANVEVCGGLQLINRWMAVAVPHLAGRVMPTVHPCERLLPPQREAHGGPRHRKPRRRNRGELPGGVLNACYTHTPHYFCPPVRGSMVDGLCAREVNETIFQLALWSVPPPKLPPPFLLPRTT